MPRRRMSLPQSPSLSVGIRRKSLATIMPIGVACGSVGMPARQLPFGGGPPGQAGMRSPHARLSQPDLYSYRGVHGQITTPQNTPGNCTPNRRILPRAGELPKRFLRRANQSDLSYRLQREREMHTSNESTPSREIEGKFSFLPLLWALSPKGINRITNIQLWGKERPCSLQ